MSKYFKVLKNTPQWEAGAILKNDDDGGYYAISDLWNTEAHDKQKLGSDYHEVSYIVENNPEWYERVYEVTILKKAKYLTKEAARKAYDELYK